MREKDRERAGGGTEEEADCEARSQDSELSQTSK